VAHGNDDHFNFIQEQYKAPGITAKQQGTLLDALVCTKEISRIKESVYDPIVEKKLGRWLFKAFF